MAEICALSYLDQSAKQLGCDTVDATCPDMVHVWLDAETRTLPDDRTFYDHAVGQQDRKYVSQHVWAGGWQQPDGTFKATGFVVRGEDVERIF